jgi:glycosyltransferase involved in cell wall biosynthesis
MNILYIASVRIPNEKASGLAIMRQCDAFSSQGHPVTLLRPNRRNHIKEEPFTFYGMEPHFEVRTMYSINFFEYLGRFGFYITRISQMFASMMYLLLCFDKYQIVYARDPWMLVLPSLLSKKKIFIWEAHQKQSHVLIRNMARRVNRIIVISNGLKDFYTTITNRLDINVEPSGVDLKQFENLPTVASLRNRFGIPKTANVIAYIGKYSTMGESKGVEELVSIFGSIKKLHPQAFLFIVGLEDTEIVGVRKLCVDSGISQSTFKLAPLIQKDFAHYVEASDILVMNYPDTEHYRNFMSPTKLFAYMAGRRLIVTSNLPTIRGIVDESMVFFCEPDSGESLLKSVSASLASSEITRKNMLDRARKKVETLTWEHRSERILKLLI